MATRGPKPKPTTLKKLTGNPGKRALNKHEPVPESAIPVCPDHFGDDARAEWNRVTEELHELGLLTNLDRAALVAYCQAWADYVKACRMLDEQDEVLISDKGNAYQNPWTGIKNTAMANLTKYAAEFGMTPSSRSRVKSEKANEEDELARLLFGGVKVKP